ncbi:MAG: hypothetical protein WAU06_03300 [Candidatus Nanopelagicales bacterium]
MIKMDNWVKTKKLSAVALSLALASGIGVATAPTADAVAPSRSVPKSWMTRSEFRWIYVSRSGWGDTYKQVRRHVGSHGKLTYQDSWYEESYCDEWSYDYDYCTHYVGGKVHTYRTFTWRTGKYSRSGASVTFEDNHATSKSFYKF